MNVRPHEVDGVAENLSHDLRALILLDEVAIHKGEASVREFLVD